MINPATQHIILKIVGFLEATELVSGPVTEMAVELLINIPLISVQQNK